MSRLEIRELIIRATVVPEGATNAGNSTAASPDSSGNNNISPNEEMINTCVEKILEIIKDKNGR